MTIVFAILIFWTDSYFVLDSLLEGDKRSSGVLVYEINTYVEALTESQSVRVSQHLGFLISIYPSRLSDPRDRRSSLSSFFLSLQKCDRHLTTIAVTFDRTRFVS